jgi:hypothetical protein
VASTDRRRVDWEDIEAQQKAAALPGQGQPLLVSDIRNIARIWRDNSLDRAAILESCETPQEVRRPGDLDVCYVSAIFDEEWPEEA